MYTCCCCRQPPSLSVSTIKDTFKRRLQLPRDFTYGRSLNSTLVDFVCWRVNGRDSVRTNCLSRGRKCNKNRSRAFELRYFGLSLPWFGLLLFNGTSHRRCLRDNSLRTFQVLRITQVISTRNSRRLSRNISLNENRNCSPTARHFAFRPLPPSPLLLLLLLLQVAATYLINVNFCT